MRLMLWMGMNLDNGIGLDLICWVWSLGIRRAKPSGSLGIGK